MFPHHNSVSISDSSLSIINVNYIGRRPLDYSLIKNDSRQSLLVSAVVFVTVTDPVNINTLLYHLAARDPQ
jgi:hypothetical protein